MTWPPKSKIIHYHEYLGCDGNCEYTLEALEVFGHCGVGE